MFVGLGTAGREVAMTASRFNYSLGIGQIGRKPSCFMKAGAQGEQLGDSHQQASCIPAHRLRTEFDTAASAIEGT